MTYEEKRQVTELHKMGLEIEEICDELSLDEAEVIIFCDELDNQRT